MVLSQLRFGNGNHGVAFRGIKEAFPDAVVGCDGGIHQDTKPCHPYAFISVQTCFTGSDRQLSALTHLKERISLNDHSYGGQSSVKQGFSQLAQEQLLSLDDVGDVILVAFESKNISWPKLSSSL